MKIFTLRGVAAFALLGFVTPKISAITFTGTVTGVVEQSIVGFPYEDYEEGSIWTFDYSYESPSIDGHFWFSHQSFGDGTFVNDGFGSVKIFNRQNSPLAADIPYSFQFPDHGYITTSIMVAGGKVENFGLSFSSGMLFIIQNGEWNWDSVLAGSVSVTDPRATGVPDNGSTLGMLVGALGVAGLATRNRRRKAIAMSANAA